MKFIKLVVIGLLLNLATLTEAEAEAEAAGEAEADPQLQYIQSHSPTWTIQSTVAGPVVKWTSLAVQIPSV